MTDINDPAEKPIPKKKRLNPKALLPGEEFWRDHQVWLAEKGYMLRPRYMPNWVPSWGSSRNYLDCEDALMNQTPQLIDASRISDGKLVGLKRIDRVLHPHEVEIGLYFSSTSLLSQPRNHCIPIYEVLSIPDNPNEVILVMPLLRAFDDPRFKSVGEAAEFFRQIFEGLQYMHHHHVAHRDCMNLNIMMDPTNIFPNMYHPKSDRRNLNFRGKAKYYTRTVRPTKYFFIDFGLSRKYEPGNSEPREDPIQGGDKTVPEFQGEGIYQPSNPFPTDIYYLGNLIREDFLQATLGVEFMKPLVEDMTHHDPSKRPSIDEVVEKFDEILHSLSWWKLRSRLVEKGEQKYPLIPIIRGIRHTFRTAVHVLTLRNALPRPSS